MELMYGIKQVMHRIRIRMYPNYLPGYENTYHARTDSEATLTVDEVCAADRERGGFPGDYSSYVEHINRFFKETAYQLADGFTINFGPFSIYPNVGGTFANIDENPDPKKHPLTFRVRINKILRELAGHISIVKDGEADPSGHITEFIDKDENAVNSIFVPGDGFIITGHKIKLAGDDPGVGVFFVPVNDPSKAVKATRIFENSSGKLIGICPDTGYQHSKIEIRTQYSGSTTVFLKSPRVITSRFTLEQA